MTEIKAEARLRRLARASGYDFHKSRRAISADNLGGYMLVDNDSNTLIAGDRYQLDLKDVESELQMLGCCPADQGGVAELAGNSEGAA